MIHVVSIQDDSYNNWTVLKSRGIGFARLDGDVWKVEALQQIVDDYNSDSSPHRILLLTPQVGGVGFSIPGANRVIINDPNWNPSIVFIASDSRRTSSFTG